MQEMLLNKTFFMATAVLINIGFASPVAAQQTVRQGVHVPTRVAKAERKIGVEAEFLTTYDSNVATSSPQRAALVGLKPEDVIISPSVNLDITLPFGRNNLTLGGTAGYDVYLRNTRRNAERIGLIGGLTSNFRTCETSLDTAFGRARSNVGNIDTTTVGAAFVDNLETTYEVGVQVSCGAAVGLRPFAAVTYSIGRNSLAIRKSSDYNTVSYGGGLSYSQPSIGELGIIGSIEQTDFTQRPKGSLALGQPKFTARSIGGFFNRELARTLRARIQLNYTNVRPGIAARSFNGLSGDVAVRIVPSGLFEIELQAGRAVSPSLSFNVDYLLETAQAIKFTAPWGPKVNLTATFDHRHRRYFGGVPLLIHPLNSDEISLISGEARLRYNRRLSFTLGAAYEFRTANDSFYNYHGFRAFASVRVAL